MDKVEKIAYSVNPHFWWRYTKGSIKFSSLNSTMHYDSSFVMTLFLRGSGYVLVEGKTVYFSDGDMLIVSPHEFHRCFINNCSDHERISLYVYPSVAKGFKVSQNVIFGAFLNRPLGEGNVIPASLVQEMKLDRLFADFHLPDENDLAADALMQCRVVEILLRLNEAVKANSKKSEVHYKNITVERAIGFINAHLKEDLSTSALAEQIAVDKFYLCRAFKKHTGVTINEYVTQKRVDLALHLLSEGATCTKACFDSGFKNYTSFYQYFRRYTGKIPKENHEKK